MAKGKLHPFLKEREYWYKDIILVCNTLPDFEREDVSLETNFSRNIKLKTPFVSSPMDTVTGAKMAILMALVGGIGVIHYNYETIEEQISEVEKVKRFSSGFVLNPIVLSPNNIVSDVAKIKQEYGFSSVPITLDGTLKTKMVGIVTRRDIRYLESKRALNTPLSKVMTSHSELITASKEKVFKNKNIKEANKIIRKHNLDTLPIVDRNFRLVALVTDSDIRKSKKFPLATKDENRQLRTLVAVESRLNLAKERIKKANDVGVDGIVVDASVVFKEQIEIAKYSKKNFPNLEVILGNVDSGKMVEEVVEKGKRWIDGLRVGIGPGAVCITQEYLGVGRAQASAVWDCVQTLKKLYKNSRSKIPIIADGGIRKPSDIAKALSLGAHTVMMGGLLAGLEEAPGEATFDEELEYMVKKYRGMGSLEAMRKGGSIRYGIEKEKIKIPEGKETKVGFKGSGYSYIPKLIAAVKQGMQKLGCKDIHTLQKKAVINPISIN